MLFGEKRKITTKGQIVIPKDIRDEFKIEIGDMLSWFEVSTDSKNDCLIFKAKLLKKETIKNAKKNK